MKSRSKAKNLTSHFAHFQNHDSENNPYCVNTIEKKVKIAPITGEASYSKDFVESLMIKLNTLEQRQKQTELKFVDCLKGLRSELEMKDKINNSLKEQIKILKNELKNCKTDLIKFRKFSKVVRPSKTPLKSADLILRQKQNIKSHPSPKQTQKSREYLTRSARLQGINTKSNISKLTLKVKGSSSYSRYSTLENQDYNNFDLEKENLTESIRTRKKTRSLAHVLKSKLFVK